MYQYKTMHMIALVIINDKTIYHGEIYTTINLIRSYQYECNCLCQSMTWDCMHCAIIQRGFLLKLPLTLNLLFEYSFMLLTLIVRPLFWYCPRLQLTCKFNKSWVTIRIGTDCLIIFLFVLRSTWVNFAWLN